MPANDGVSGTGEHFKLGGNLDGYELAGRGKELAWRSHRGPAAMGIAGNLTGFRGKLGRIAIFRQKGIQGKRKNADKENRNFFKNESFGIIYFIMEKRYFPRQMGYNP
jgi:hypothetical protein